MSDYIDELYPIALDCDISPSLFWNLSVQEVFDLISSYERKEKRKQKQIAIDNYYLSTQIIEGISLILNGDENNTSLKMVWDYYPDLFKEEEKIHNQIQEQDDLDKAKAGRRRLANAMNKKYKGDD